MSIKPTINNLNELIINNKILTEQTKNILFEYCNDTTIHSILNITFGELLLNVYSLTLCNAHSDEIFDVMNIEMNDALCKCFTGRISRLVNCLSGYSNKVVIQISESEEISNIISIVMSKRGMKESDEIKEEVRMALKERGYEDTKIKEWLEYVE